MIVRGCTYDLVPSHAFALFVPLCTVYKSPHYLLYCWQAIDDAIECIRIRCVVDTNEGSISVRCFVYTIKAVDVVRAHSCWSKAQLITSNKLAIDNLQSEATLHPLAT